MNCGYIKTNDWDNPIHSSNCPICGKNIYVSKYYNDYACSDINCALGHGARNLITKVDTLLLMLDNHKNIPPVSKT